MITRNRVCLWYDGAALEAATFYARTFPDSHVGNVFRAPTDYPAGSAGDVLTVDFTVAGVPGLGMNGVPVVHHSAVSSFQIATEDQAQTDRLWQAIVDNGDQQSACGSCMDS